MYKYIGSLLPFHQRDEMWTKKLVKASDYWYKLIWYDPLPPPPPLFLITENATGNMYPPLYLILPAGTVCVPASAVSHHLQFNVMYLPQLWTNRNIVTLLRFHQCRLWLCCIALQFITHREKKSKLILFMIYYDTLNNTSSKSMTLLGGCDDWNWFCMCWNAFVMDYIRLGGCLW